MLRCRGRAGRAAPRPVELPSVNMLVRLAADPEAGEAGRAGAELASRVEDVVAGACGPVRLLVAAPGYRGDLIDPDPGQTWLLSWVSERGRWELPVHREDAEGSVPRSWWLTPAGPARRRQRRRFYRAGCCVPVELDQLCDPFQTLAGCALDLSEGGLRCLLPVPDGGVAPGTRVLVRVGLDGIDGVLEGVVLRSRRPARAVRIAGWHREVAVAFDDPERHGDVVRRVVVRLQLRARRLAPPGGP